MERIFNISLSKSYPATEGFRHESGFDWEAFAPICSRCPTGAVRYCRVLLPIGDEDDPVAFRFLRVCSEGLL